MNIAVIGSGGREHSLCYKLKKSKKVNNMICVPGNAGTKDIAKNIEADITNFENLYKIFLENKTDLIVVGPENPLVDGIVDFLEYHDVFMKFRDVFMKFNNHVLGDILPPITKCKIIYMKKNHIPKVKKIGIIFFIALTG